MKDFMEKFNKVHIMVSGVFLIIFFIVIVFQIVSRMLGVSATWTEDVTTNSFIWSVFLGGSAMVYPERHFAFTSIIDHITDEYKKSILHLVIQVCMLIFMVLLFYYGVIITKKYWNRVFINIPGVKSGWTWLCLPICGGTGILYLVQKIVADIGTITRGGK